MEKIIEYYLAIIAITAVTVLNGCNKEKLVTNTPEVTAPEATNITPEEAELKGSVNANNLSAVVTFEYGTNTNYDKMIMAEQSPVTGNTNTKVSAHITGLTPGIVFYFRIKAENSLGITYSRDTTFRTEYTVGEKIYGGIIFYIDGSGKHGLVCAPEDQANVAEWGCEGTKIPGADGTVVGTGNQNTTDIVNGCFTAGIAAKICYDLVLNTYSDWYLPSQDELALMYTKLKKNKLGGFADAYYWSSTECNEGYQIDKFAWMQAFDDGSGGYGGKSGKHYVRAIRAF